MKGQGGFTRIIIVKGVAMFTGISDKEWEVFDSLIPKKEKRTRGMPHANHRYVLNSIFWIVLTQRPWKDLPKRENFASKSSSHRWFQRWKADGTWEKILKHMVELAIYKKIEDEKQEEKAQPLLEALTAAKEQASEAAACVAVNN